MPATRADIAALRTYAKNAHAAFASLADRLATRLKTNPLGVEARDHDEFMATGALLRIYHDAITLDGEGNSPDNDGHVLTRIRAARTVQSNWLRISKTLQTGIHAVQSHHAQEAARRFLSDTAFVDYS
ncbi:hypothetical protein [Streptomyces sp. NPDC001933]|uniref:hypothetical protein n=1 Tax=Streptomyces sp. NPDC001933 TaxID=3364626 RepID=UPI00369594A3